jgi:hypothetical protein
MFYGFTFSVRLQNVPQMRGQRLKFGFLPFEIQLQPSAERLGVQLLQYRMGITLANGL